MCEHYFCGISETVDPDLPVVSKAMKNNICIGIHVCRNVYLLSRGC